MIPQTKTLKRKSFLAFNFAVTKIRVAIRLERMGQEWAAYNFDYPLVYSFIFIHKHSWENVKVYFRLLYIKSSVCFRKTHAQWLIRRVIMELQKQPLEVFCKKRCS